MTKEIKKFGVLKTDRISTTGEIRDLLAHGKRFKSGNITIIYRESNRHGAGFIASRHINSAVKRNRTKRILREAYRMHKDIFKGLKVIFLARSAVDFKTAAHIFIAFGEGK